MSVSTVRWLCGACLLLGGVVRAEELAASPVPSLESLQAQLAAMKRDLDGQRRELDEQRHDLAEQRRDFDGQKALTESSLAEETSSREPVLRIYGFADMGLQKVFMNIENPLRAIIPSASTTFVMGNINLYFDAQPSPDWAALVELRLTNLPNGTDSAGTGGRPYSRTSTTVYDATSASGGWTQVKLGSIIIERAYIAWQRYHIFNVRVGAILTPFGIWNVDHGTPTLIALMLPQFEISELFPTHQVGVEMLGTHRWTTAELGYYLYITNGRTPGEVSLTDDAKLLGGRLFLTLSHPYRITLGASGFVSRERDQERIISDTLVPSLKVNTTVAYDEQAGGLDFSLDAKGVRLRSEFAIRHVAYQTDKRALVWGIPGLFDPDHFDWDFYTLLAYRLPWWGLEPYLYLEIHDFRNPFSDGYLTSSFGLNIHFTSFAQLKFQYADARAFRSVDTLAFQRGPGSWYDIVALRLVLAF